MARVNNLTNFLTDVASAIKQKTGDNTAIPAADFDTEILSIETVGNYQTKSVTITDNGNYSISPDQNYDAIDRLDLSVTVAASEDLDTVLTAQEQKLSQLDEIINRKMAGNNMSLNIFVQPTEPATKKGLWLQTNHTYENIILDENVYYGDEWESSASTPVIPYKASYSSSVSIGNDVYVFGGATTINAGNETNSLTAYKYNILANTWTQLTDIPYYFFFGGTTSVGTDIYIFGSHNSSYSKRAYKYDTLTDTYTRLTDIPFNYADMPVVSIGTDIYLFGGGGWNVKYTAYKYDTLTDTYTQLKNIPYEFYYTSYEAVNTDIYLFGGYGGNKKAYKYDTLTDTYTQLSDIPYQFSGGSTTVIDTDIYLFGGNGGNKKVYRYNVLTDTYTQLSNAPHNINAGSGARSVCNVNGDIYVIPYYKSGDDSGTGIDIYHFNSKTYSDDNSLIIAQGRSGAGKTYNIGYATELVTINTLSIPLLYGLVDAWFYTTQDGLDDTIPTYYGDGIQWVNFKNPIQGGNE